MEASQPININVNEFAKISVFAGPGQELKLGQLWQKQTAILVFLRHFACIACRAHAAQVWGEREKYERTGAKIIFIGNGQPSWIEPFRQELGIEKGVILTDPSLKSFKAAGLKNGVLTLAQPSSVINGIKLARKGYIQKPYDKTAGTHWQMGGIVAVNPRGKIVFYYASQALGDVPDEPYIEIIRQDEKVAME